MLKNKCVLGIDLGGTNLRLGLVDESYHLFAFECISTRDTFAEGCDIAQKLTEHVHNYCKTYLQGEMPLAVCIGFPSTINRQRTIVVQTPNIAPIPDNFAVVEELQKRLALPVYINRDVNFLLLFDLEDLDVADKECVAGIYFGTGIGNAISFNGRLLLGRNGAAAELGHLPVYGNKKMCKCGNISCLETAVSGIALEEIQKSFFPHTDISQMFEKHTDSPEMQEFLNGMGQTVAAEVNLLDPDCVILGGGLLQMKGFPKKKLEEAIHRYARKPYPEINLDIRYSRANQQNGVIGAGIYAFKRINDTNYL